MSSNNITILLPVLAVTLAGCQPDLYERKGGESAFLLPIGEATARNVIAQTAGPGNRARKGTTVLNNRFMAEAPSFVDFQLGSAEITPLMIEAFQKQAEWLRANPGASIRVMGRGDNRLDTVAYNDLAMRRAQATIDYFGILGISADRLIADVEPHAVADLAPRLVDAAPPPPAVVSVETVPTQPLEPIDTGLVYLEDALPTVEPFFTEVLETAPAEVIPIEIADAPAPIEVEPVYIEAPEAEVVISEPVFAPADFGPAPVVEPIFVAAPTAPLVNYDLPFSSAPTVQSLTPVGPPRLPHSATYGGVRIVAFERPGLDGTRAALQSGRYNTDNVQTPAEITTTSGGS